MNHDASIDKEEAAISRLEVLATSVAEWVLRSPSEPPPEQLSEIAVGLSLIILLKTFGSIVTFERLQDHL